ncbi:unnamed protein product [Discosporangium mesarthrocarpum]
MQVPFPSILEKFLSVINFANLDMGWIFSASCFLTDGTNFYHRMIMVAAVPKLTVGALSAIYRFGTAFEGYSTAERVGHEVTTTEAGENSSTTEVPESLGDFTATISLAAVRVKCVVLRSNTRGTF